MIITTEILLGLFRQFNETIHREKKLTRAAAGSYDRLLLNENPLGDAFIVAHHINTIVLDPNALTGELIQKGHVLSMPDFHPDGRITFSSNSVPLINSVLIYKYDDYVNVLIKPRIHYSDPVERRDTFHGSSRIVKPYGFFIQISISQRRVLDARREVTFSRGYDQIVAEVKGRLPKSSRLTKLTPNVVKNLWNHVDFIGYTQVLFYERTLTNLNAFWAHAPYMGLPLSNYYGHSFTPQQNGQMIFSYLCHLSKIVREGMWPSDLKISNTCLNVSADNRLSLSLIDYGHMYLSTYSVFKKQAQSLRRWSLPECFRSRRLLCRAEASVIPSVYTKHVRDIEFKSVGDSEAAMVIQRAAYMAAVQAREAGADLAGIRASAATAMSEAQVEAEAVGRAVAAVARAGGSAAEDFTARARALASMRGRQKPSSAAAAAEVDEADKLLPNYSLDSMEAGMFDVTYQIAEDEDEQMMEVFYTAKYQLIVELLHTFLILTSWQYFIEINELRHDVALPNPPEGTPFSPDTLLTMLQVKLSSAEAAKYKRSLNPLRSGAHFPFVNILTRVLYEVIRDAANPNLDIGETTGHCFENIFREIRSIHYPTRILWPEEFTDAWITQNAKYFDYFSPHASGPLKIFVPDLEIYD